MENNGTEQTDFTQFIPREKHVKVLGPDGKAHDCVLVPASSGATVNYRNAKYAGARMTADGMVEMPPLNTVQIVLVAGCMYRLEGGGRTPCTEAWVRGIQPGNVIDSLFELCKQLSPWLDKDQETAVPKASSTGGTPTSG